MLTFAVRLLREPVIRATALAIVCLTTALLLMGRPALAQDPEGPPGNNGTIKVHEDDGEPTPVVRNQPHVGCSFHLHLFGADPEQAGDWWILAWPPTGDRTEEMRGTYEADMNGEVRVPDTGAFVEELEDGHYKLFWDGDTTPGGQTPIKHKVFWVECPGDVQGDVLGGSPSGQQLGGEGVLGAAGGSGGELLPDTATGAPAAAGGAALIAILAAIALSGAAWRARCARHALTD